MAVVELDDGRRVSALVTCEAKQTKDRILADQIVQQVIAAYKSVRGSDLSIELVIPIAIKATRDGEIFVVEFAAWTPDMAEVDESALSELSTASEGLYQILPHVPGIGRKPKKVRKKGVKKIGP